MDALATAATLFFAIIRPAVAVKMGENRGQKIGQGDRHLFFLGNLRELEVGHSVLLKNSRKVSP